MTLGGTIQSTTSVPEKARRGFGVCNSTLGNCGEQASKVYENQKEPKFCLTYRRGVLISRRADTLTHFPETKSRSKLGSKGVRAVTVDTPNERRESYTSWPSQFGNTKLRNANSLEICSNFGTGSTEFINLKLERNLSLPVDINRLHIERSDMSLNGHGRHHCSTPHIKPPKPKDFVSGFALLEACQANNEGKAKELVRKMCCLSSAEVGPLVNFQDQTGRTPLSFACAIGNISIIEELTKLRRLDPNLGDNDGNAPLHYAAQAGHTTVVDLLLIRFEGIIDPNGRNSTGLTPLHKAALQGRSRVAKSLILAGASPHLRDYSRNMTAMDWARLTGRHICAEVIVRCARDHCCPSVGTPPGNFNPISRSIPASQSSMELKRMNSDESPYYHLQNARNAISGANWLKNKIRKALGSTGTQPSRSESAFTLVSNLGGATICAGSLLLPSIKPIIDQQKPKVVHKLKIPTVQVTQVKR